MRFVRPLLFLFALVPAIAGAAEPPAVAASKPEDVARRMMKLTHDADWAAYAKLMHPDALSEFKRMFGEIVGAEPTKELGRMFFGTENAAAYQALDGTTLFVRFMTNLSKNVPQFAEALKSADAVVIGSVAESPDLVHVVYRSSAAADGIAISRVSAVTLRRHQGEWRVLLTGSIEGIAARLGAMAKQ